MTTTEHPTGQMTRRQIRELRLTGQTPVITEADLAEHALQRAAEAEAEAQAEAERAEESAPRDTASEDNAAKQDAPEQDTTEAPAAEVPSFAPPVVPVPAAAPVSSSSHSSASPVGEKPVAPVAPLAHAVDTIVPPAAVVSEDTDESHPRTRRAAREQERVRTASVPIIAPNMETFAPAEPLRVTTPVEAPSQWAPPATVTNDNAVAETVEEIELHVSEISDATYGEQRFGAAVHEEDIVDAEIIDTPSPLAEAPAWGTPLVQAEPEHAAAHLAPTFGEAILDSSVAPEAEESFDSLLGRDESMRGRDFDTSGSSSRASALILPDASLAPLTAPVASSGETLITGTFSLPESLSSQGHVGAADGKDVDVVLIDGELPPASSPTPIAATAAVSQAKTPGEIIKPPAPEKGNKLTLALLITTGALALTVGAFFVIAIATGVL